VNTTSPPFKLLLTNSGNAPLNISSIAIAGTNAGDFAQTNVCQPSLPAGKSCTITVKFGPTVIGPRTAYVMVADNAPGSPHNVYMVGKAK
jgi:hypothetical protein